MGQGTSSTGAVRVEVLSTYGEPEDDTNSLREKIPCPIEPPSNTPQRRDHPIEWVIGLFYLAFGFFPDR